jgi:SAM-dependent methyltransferase
MQRGFTVNVVRPTVHPAAATGFGGSAGAYARGRPDYPHALDDWLRGPVGLGDGKIAVDLGAGTGKFVPRLLATGARVIAVEPVGAMRARLQADLPQVACVDGSAEALPFDDAAIDAVVCAQSFHWFATDAAVAEIARVVRPGGVLVLVWNVRDESVAWVERLTRLLLPYESDVPRYHKGTWRRVFPAAGFGPLEEAHFPHVHRGTPDEVVVERFLSVSFIAALPAAERSRVERQLRALVAEEPALAGRERIEMPYDTVAFVARRS